MGIIKITYTGLIADHAGDFGIRGYSFRLYAFQQGGKYMLLHDSRNEAFLCCEPSTVDEQEWYTRKQAAKRLCYTVGSMAVFDCTGKYDFKPNRDKPYVRYPKAHIELFRLERFKVKRYFRKSKARKSLPTKH